MAMMTTRKKLLVTRGVKKREHSKLCSSATFVNCASLVVILLVSTQCFLLYSYIERSEHIHHSVSLIACSKDVDGKIPHACRDKRKKKFARIEKEDVLSLPMTSTDSHQESEPIGSVSTRSEGGGEEEEDDEQSTRSEGGEEEGDDEQRSKICPTFSGDTVEGYATRKALVLFASPRSGSTTLHSMMKAIDEKTDTKEFHLLSQGGLFTYGNDSFYQILSTARLLLSSCEESNKFWSSGGLKEAVQKGDWKNFQSLMQKYESTNKLLDEFSQRFKSVSNYFRYMRSIVPQISKRPFLTFKVFDFHLKTKGTDMSMNDFVRELKDAWRGHDDDDGLKVVVLWRRCMIEQFVSNKIASNRKMFTQVSTTEKDAIHVDKDELEEFLEKKRQYYLGVKKALVDNGVPFEVLEYDRDIKNDSNKVVSRKRLLDMFGLPDEQQEDVPGKLASTKKQSIVPLEKLILNFEEVKAWGYGKPLDEWEDLFSDHTGA